MINLWTNKVWHRSCSFFLLGNLWIIPNLHSSKAAFVDKKEIPHENRSLQETDVRGNYSIHWDIDLDGKEFILEFPYLRAGLMRAVKDYINDDLKCHTESNLSKASFYSVEIIKDDEGRVSGSGVCRGSRERCKWGVSETKSSARKDTSVVSSNANDAVCAKYQNSTIFDYFKATFMTGIFFTYDANVNVISDLHGSLDLNYNVTFNPAQGNGLDQITSIELSAQEPVEIDPICTTTQCILQRATMFHIYRHFGIPVDLEKHECLYHGVNCNLDGLVSQIYLVGYDFSNIIIPEEIGSLQSLKGLFLGGNQLVGTIPSTLAQLRDLKILWLEDNKLSGRIPTELGNLEGLLELNLHDNLLTGTIPEHLGKLYNLELLNLGKSI